jgi:hypothetical protein
MVRVRALVIFTLAIVAACDSTTAVAPTQNVATSLTIVANDGGSAQQLALELGDTLTLSAVATNPLGLAVPAGAVAWSSTDAAVVQVDASGFVSAVGVGTADIRASAGEAVSSLQAVVSDTTSF